MSTKQKLDLESETHVKNLRLNSYPGRGIIMGLSQSGELVQIYWIMGRSTNSRNRVFVVEGNDLATRAADPSALSDPSLIIYYPMRVRKNVHIVSNGDQTDTIADAYENGGWWPEEIPVRFSDALRARTYEPDPPHFTPRISGIACAESARAAKNGKGGWAYVLSILKSTSGVEAASQRNTYAYDCFLPSFGHLIHTYEGDAEILPTFFGEPRLVPILDSAESNMKYYWELLNHDNRVSMFVKHLDLESGKSNLIVQNRFTAV